MQGKSARFLIIFFCMLMSAFPRVGFAAVELNTADQVALDGLNGLGPTKSKVILAERKKNGHFTSWVDFKNRVKGVGQKNAQKLSDAGLVIDGQSFTEFGAKASETKATEATEATEATRATKATKATKANTKAHLPETQGAAKSK